MVKRMKAVKLTILLVLGLALMVSTTARGNGPSTRPVVPSGNFSTEIRAALRNMFMIPRANLVHFTPDEWNEMMSFMEIYSPARWSVLQMTDLPEESTIRQGLIRKWRAYRFVKEHFPEMARLQERRFTLEDDLFKLAMDEKDWEKEGSTPAGDGEDIRERIHAKVAELVELGIQEDQLRIDRLNRMLGELHAKLAQDKASAQHRIDDRTERLMGHFPWPATRPSALPPRTDSGNGDATPISNQADADVAADAN